MATQSTNDETKNTHLAGKYSIASQSIGAFIGGIMAIIGAIIGLYAVNDTNTPHESAEASARIAVLEQQLADLREEVSELEQANAQLQAENETLRRKAGTETQGPVLFKGHKYQAFSDNMTWTNAKLYCESLGGHLVTITDISESMFLRDYLSEIESPKSYYWIGLHCIDSNRTWGWVTGESFSFDNWAIGEPSNTGGEENYTIAFCKVSEDGHVLVGEWVDVSDTGSNYQRTQFGLICEWDTSE